MDRDNRWERVEPGYRAMVDASPKTEFTALEYIEASYAKDETDEFIEPVAFSGYEGMQKGDALISVNFRSDRVREIITALGDKDFDGFQREFKALHIATMTEYNKSFDYPVMFPKDAPKNTLAEVISKAGLNQLHTAETEKYAHVTFFLNGGVDEPFLNETRVLIPSPKVKTYDEKPEMSAPQVGETVRKAMDEETDFIVVNFANGDMVGHTGNIEASIKAVEAVDRELGMIFDKAKENDYAVVLTSDHGNCEEMKDVDGNVLTNHTVGKVWCFVDAPGVDKVKTGGLNNIAPTVLTLMGLDIPEEMDESLI
jgi:2,3-bisphosphoglycerate-independent phosphoglycerate mutase